MIPAAPEPHPWRRALAWLSFLAPFFFLSYGFANWAAAQRASVPAMAFAWEHAIPFYAWTIVPYWSIDALYGLSLFVCVTRGELDAHAKRLLTAQLVAIFFFIAMPYRFSFDRPAADGAFGALFDLLAGFDLPFNQVPSLHIALAVVLWTLYARKVRGLARILLDVWFILIGASVLTTYQHHFVDLPTGFALGWLCVWLWPMPDGRVAAPFASWQRSPDPARHRLSFLYGLGAGACLAIALLFGGEALWLLWPALSLGIVAAGYAGLGASAFQKDADGRISTAARWLLAPYLVGAWLNSRWWTRRRPAPVQIADDVWIGRAPSRRDLARFAGVVDLSAEIELPRTPLRRAIVPVLDLTIPDNAALAEAARAIDTIRKNGPVLVCCALGYSRSACAIAAWLMATGRAATVEAAFERIRMVRGEVVLNAAHATALRALP
jgi:protein-tyrosine phosphatase